MSLIGSVYNSRTGYTTTHFERIVQKEKVKKECSNCNKVRTRTIESSQTVNPFNRHDDGVVKTQSEVIQSVKENLKKLVAKFKREKFVCGPCIKIQEMAEDARA